MKHTTYFPKFLRDEVNINQTRLDNLDDRVQAVYKAMKNDDTVGPLVVDKIPQGSWPHRTIINPQAGCDFDADFLLQLKRNPDWDDNPSAYPNAVYAALNAHTIYSSMPHGRRTRCVYLEYSPVGDIGCHLDIVPYVEQTWGDPKIVNRKANVFEGTNPLAFTTWIKGKDDATNGNFRKVVRLMKYYKVHCGNFNGVPSVILTSLLGEQVMSYKAILDPSYYGDLATSLIHIVNDLHSWLDDRPTRPSVTNPGGDGTTFDHRWDDAAYTGFRACMASTAERMNAAAEADAVQSANLWQDLFGDKFQPSSPTKVAAAPKFGGTAAGLGFASQSGKSG